MTGPSCNLFEALYAVSERLGGSPGNITALHDVASFWRVLTVAASVTEIFCSPASYEVVVLWLRYVGRQTSPVPAGAGRTLPSAGGRTSSCSSARTVNVSRSERSASARPSRSACAAPCEENALTTPSPGRRSTARGAA